MLGVVIIVAFPILKVSVIALLFIFGFACFCEKSVKNRLCGVFIGVVNQCLFSLFIRILNILLLWVIVVMMLPAWIIAPVFIVVL